MAQAIVDQVSAVNESAAPFGSVGVVVGVTAREAGVDLSRLGGPVLAPGLGAQGGRPEDLAAVFAAVRGLVLPSSSREILARGPAVAALKDSTHQLMNECRNVLKLANL